MKTEKSVKVKKSDLWDMLWMSIRYAVGRHSIHSCTYPYTVITYADLLEDRQRERLTEEIRMCLNDMLNFRSSFCHVSGTSRKRDAVSVLLKYLHDNGISLRDTEWFNAKRFTINVDKDEVEIEVLTDPDKIKDNKFYADFLYNDIEDLTQWIKLANYLDRDAYRTVEYKGQKFDAFHYYTVNHNGNVAIRWIDPGTYKKEPWFEYYMAEDEIKEPDKTDFRQELMDIVSKYGTEKSDLYHFYLDPNNEEDELSVSEDGIFLYYKNKELWHDDEQLIKELLDRARIATSYPQFELWKKFRNI